MKKNLPLFFILLTLSLYSCEKECDCQQNWVNDCNLTYYPGNLVKHNGVCYKAFAQGTACMVEPGTQMGDIWGICN